MCKYKKTETQESRILEIQNDSWGETILNRAYK